MINFALIFYVIRALQLHYFKTNSGAHFYASYSFHELYERTQILL